MKKALLTLAVLAGSLVYTSPSHAAYFFETPSFLGPKNIFIDLGYIYNISYQAVSYGDSSDNKFDKKVIDFSSSGVKVGAKYFLTSSSESDNAFFFSPYLAMLKNEVTNTDKKCSNCSDIFDNNIVSTNIPSVGLELGISNNGPNPFVTYFALDLSQNLRDYKALGTGLKLGMGYRGSLGIFYLDVGWKHFGKAEWKELSSKPENNNLKVQYKVQGFKSINVVSVSCGVSF